MSRLSALLSANILPDPASAAEPTTEAARYAHAGREPTLDDLLDDPLVHLVLARDGLDRADVRARMRAAAASLQKKGGPGRG